MRCNVVRGKPRFVSREDRRDEGAPGPENLCVTTYCFWTVDKIKDRVDTSGQDFRRASMTSPVLVS